MLQLGKKLRLTLNEARFFKVLTGSHLSPTSVDDYNRAIKRTAEHYHLLAAQEDSADAELLARIAEGELITAEPASEPDER
ncbi:hypothetical protein G3O06_01640 [Burkholderia sp. Ac-20345]|uniref:hypothetical protein n=1 Tax=Burkholderia sp. Ac-20345 TaxID=2703891 RepID=UPI00197C56D4|nr:hypothetical protein [Burkholderia sp. Ac-20345]MBN3776265.1 hypothetical protein [Burkholderia sp. Ac-20345]